jgi:hypothetical protein
MTLGSVKFYRSTLHLSSKPEEKVCTEQLAEFTITKEAVEKKLTKLNPYKSPGPDQLHPRILKEMATHLSEAIATLFSLSISSGRLPAVWRNANVTPIYKNKGDRHEAKNYRPISLTCILCKILEALFREHLITHLDNNEFITKDQFGFVGGRSSATAAHPLG